MKKGFTLVELAIVFVIIGLIIGGILVAQSMISASKTLKIIQDVKAVEVAATNFKTKFGCIPGDCGAGTTFAVAGNYCTSGMNAAQDGYIFASSSLGTYYGGYCESGAFAYQMLLSGDLSNDIIYKGTTKTKAVIGSQTCSGGVICTFAYSKAADAYIVPMSMDAFGYSGLTKGNFLTITLGDYTNQWAMPGFNSNSLALTANEARAIDAKIDDGLPLTGNVLQIDRDAGAADSICASVIAGYQGPCIGYSSQTSVHWAKCSTSNNSATSKYQNLNASRDSNYAGCKIGIKTDL